jgi:hypothetical protein
MDSLRVILKSTIIGGFLYNIPKTGYIRELRKTLENWAEKLENEAQET